MAEAHTIPRTHFYAPDTADTRPSLAEYATHFHDVDETQTYVLFVPRSAFRGPYNEDWGPGQDHMGHLLTMFRAQVVARPERTSAAFPRRHAQGLVAMRVPGVEGIFYMLHFTAQVAPAEGGGDGGGGGDGDGDDEEAAFAGAWDGAAAERKVAPKALNVHTLAPPEWHRVALVHPYSKDLKKIGADFAATGGRSGAWRTFLKTSPLAFEGMRALYGGEGVHAMEDMTLELAAQLAARASGMGPGEILRHFRPQGMRLPREAENLYRYTPDMLDQDTWRTFRRAFDAPPDYLLDDTVARILNAQPDLSPECARALALANPLPDRVVEPRPIAVVCDAMREDGESEPVVLARLNALAHGASQGCCSKALEGALGVKVLGPLPPKPPLSDAFRPPLDDPALVDAGDHITFEGRPLGASYLILFAMESMWHLGYSPKPLAYLHTVVCTLAAALDPMARPHGIGPTRLSHVQFGPPGTGKTTLHTYPETMLPVCAREMMLHMTNSVGKGSTDRTGSMPVVDEGGSLVGVDAKTNDEFAKGRKPASDGVATTELERIYRQWCSGVLVESTRLQAVAGNGYQEYTQKSRPPSSLMVSMNLVTPTQLPAAVRDRVRAIAIDHTPGANTESTAFVAQHLHEVDAVKAWTAKTVTRVWAYNLRRAFAERAGVAATIGFNAIATHVAPLSLAFNRYCVYPEWTARRTDITANWAATFMRFAHYVRTCPHLPPTAHAFVMDRGPIAFSSAAESRDIALLSALCIVKNAVWEEGCAVVAAMLRRRLVPNVAEPSMAAVLDAFDALPPSEKRLGQYVCISRLQPPAIQLDEAASQRAALLAFARDEFEARSGFGALGEHVSYRTLFEMTNTDCITHRTGHQRLPALIIHGSQVHAHVRLLIAMPLLDAVRSTLEAPLAIHAPVTQGRVHVTVRTVVLRPWSADERLARAALEARI